MKSRLFFLLAVCCLFLPRNVYQDTFKIAPYGNSITQGAKSRYSYRYNLWKKLIDAEIEFDFVGTMTSNNGGNPNWPDYKGKSFDKDHEGHWGWVADKILKDTESWLKKYTPDMVLFHIGTNDCYKQKQNAKGIISELKQIIELLRKDNPKVVVFLASLIPCRSVGSYIAALNAEIPGFSKEITTAQSPVIFVDQNTGMSSSDLYDGIHPGPTGEEKMAQKWFDAISEYVSKNTTENNYIFRPVIASTRKSTGQYTRSFNSLQSYDSQTVIGINNLTEGFIFNLQGRKMLDYRTTGHKTGGVYIISVPK